MSKAQELAMKCISKFESDTMSLGTNEYNSLSYEIEAIIKEAAKLQREAIAEELSAKAIESNMASKIIFESVAHNIAMNTIAV